MTNSHKIVLFPYLKQGLTLACLSTFIWAETVTLSPIDIHTAAQGSGIVVLSESEALETNSITLEERLARDVSFSIVQDSKGEEEISFRGLNYSCQSC